MEPLFNRHEPLPGKPGALVFSKLPGITVSGSVNFIKNGSTDFLHG
jgi:hypothetical protein